jgi:hypothetical protein
MMDLVFAMKGKKMENYIICPNCNKTIINDPLIEAAARKEGSGARAIICDCGDRITFWAITAQLRKQNSRGQRFRNWLQNTFTSQG